MNELMKRYEAETGEKATYRDIARNGLKYDFISPEYYFWCAKKIDSLEKENAKLKNQLRWRPVSEKPKEGQIVFTMIPTGWVVAQYLNGEFYVDDGFTFGDRISGVNNWLPIPPVPEGE